MKRKLSLIALTLVLAAPIGLTTGCYSPSGKAYKADKAEVADVKSAMTAWYALVVADRVTADQEIHMRDLLNVYLNAQNAVKAVVSKSPVDPGLLSIAQAQLKTSGDAVVAYLNSVNH